MCAVILIACTVTINLFDAKQTCCNFDASVSDFFLLHLG